MDVRTIPTSRGPARVHLQPPVGIPRGLLVLGHGAGGGVGAPDLVAVCAGAGALGLTAVLVEQPYRVAGRRSAAPAAHLDEAWIAVLASLRAELAGGVLVTGGRSSGARVACRTAAATGADAVLCLAFPLQPPPRAGRPAAPSRQPELNAVTVPMLVVQGEGDQFGMPRPRGSRKVVRVRGNHSLRSDVPAVRAAVGRWLADVLG